MGFISQSWGWAEYEGLEQELVQENECILGVWKKKKAAAPAPTTIPLWAYLMKVFAAIATVAPGTSTDRLGKQTVQWC